MDEKQWRQGLKTGDSVVMRLAMVVVGGKVTRSSRYKVHCVSSDGEMRKTFSRVTGDESYSSFAQGWRLVLPTPELAKLVEHEMALVQAERQVEQSRQAKSSRYKITVTMRGITIILISSTEPKMLKAGEPKFDWTPVGGCDILGYIDWDTVCAVSWVAEAQTSQRRLYRPVRKVTKPDIKVDLG